MADQYREVRLQKINNWKERQVAYPGRFEKSHSCAEVKNLEDGVKELAVSGRLMAMRIMGKLAFMTIQDATAKLQLSFQVDVLGKDEFKFLTKNLDIGDHVGAWGHTFTTQRGEKTIAVEKAILLSKGLRTLPEKFHGLQDQEMKARFRFLDLIMNEDTRKRFEVRHKVMHFIRKFLVENKFIEVETPILQSASCGASARPFITHHNALDIPLYLRIAPETYLKRLIAGGYERVFEMGRCFRNEGIDPSHLQEFTMLEFYAAYWDYRDNMHFIQSLLQNLLQEVFGTQVIEYQGTQLDFSGEWKEYTYRELVLEHTGIDLDEKRDLESLQNAVKEKGIDLPLGKYVGYAALVDALYKKACRPNLVQPCFLTMHPAELVPLARKSDDDGRKLDMFQVLVNGWEIVKAYSELVDPIEQRLRLEEQAELAKAGDEEAMMMEEDFVLAMEYGMPPISGLGLGIERVVALLTNSLNIRDVIYFPSLRPPTLSEMDD
ncbi:MAG: lysine--tRNA ligase [Bdellovibrionales bacterium]|nr:lysine--tRNA ligase [Bdellovibrionales bacterium]